MSANFVQILELAAELSEDEYILLIKEFSTALAERKKIQSSLSEDEMALLASAKQTRSKVLSGEIGTLSLSEAKAKIRSNADG